MAISFGPNFHFFLSMLLALTFSFSLDLNRITLHARAITAFIFHTLLEDINKNDSARLLARSLNVWSAAS